ncbi:MAG: DUF2158 domain-containing protein [Chloroflexi bacterium]|nr:DUF2158 domain-containing protein [Chloroflexota bacterium]
MIRFQAGDLVRRALGGPLMTISELSADAETAHCTWFDGREMRRAPFPTGRLEADHQADWRDQFIKD